MVDKVLNAVQVKQENALGFIFSMSYVGADIPVAVCKCPRVCARVHVCALVAGKRTELP